jgi:guanylate kinase
LRDRGQDSDAVIARRLANAKGEVDRLPEYDYVVVNDRLEDAVGDLLAVLRAEKRRVARSTDDLQRLAYLH